MDILEILNQVNVLNYDNGKTFVDCSRLHRIDALLWDTPYKRINPQGLFQLYSRLPISKLPREVIVVSTHVDCVHSITRCFTEALNTDEIKGTFDNSLTNATILSLMLDCVLPDNILVAFTGDEEENGAGARDVISFLKANRITADVVILDVTDMGWREACDFTIENNFWSHSIEAAVVQAAISTDLKWRFVPEDVDDIPRAVPRSHVIFEEAEADESWEYDELGVSCFSVCIPVYGDMHSNAGVVARTAGIRHYVSALQQILLALSAQCAET